MGNIIHVLVIDENEDRVNQLREHLSIHAPDIKIDHTTDILSFIHLVETNSYNCILSSELDLVIKKGTYFKYSSTHQSTQTHIPRRHKTTRIHE